VPPPVVVVVVFGVVVVVVGGVVVVVDRVVVVVDDVVVVDRVVVVVVGVVVVVVVGRVVVVVGGTPPQVTPLTVKDDGTPLALPFHEPRKPREATAPLPRLPFHASLVAETLEPDWMNLPPQLWVTV